MNVTKPDYYDKFFCIADKCPDTCCALWQVELDLRDAQRYKGYITSGTQTGKLLADAANKRLTCFKQNKCGGCVFLNSSLLCDLHIAAGHDSLPATCRLYPRFFNRYGKYEETGLSFSCPEAARLIYENNGSFYSVDDERDLCDYTNVDAELFFKVRRLRDELLNAIEDFEGSAEELENKVLSFASNAQNIIDGKCTNSSSDKNTCGSILFNEAIRLKALKKHIGNKHLRAEWKQELKKALHNKPDYDVSDLKCWLKYFIFRYVIKACEDGNFLGRVKAAFVSLTVISSVGHSFVLAAQKYSKETEHNLRNVNRLFAFSKRL